MLDAGKQIITLDGSRLNRPPETHIISEPDAEEEEKAVDIPSIRIPTYGMSAICTHCDDWRQPYRSVNVEEDDCYRCCACNSIIADEDVIVMSDTLDSIAF